MKQLDELLDACTYELEIYSISYSMMGQMLDKEYIKTRIEMLRLSDIFIYGGGYLGIQLYNAINQYVNVLKIVDRNGKALIDLSDIPVISLEDFKSIYKGQEVIITPIKYYKSICLELSKFVSIDKIIYLGEFLGGTL